MWDFSWLERRWPGAGYENWDLALDELAERGYDAVRIDAYPHLVAADPHRQWELLPMWTQNVWGAQSLVRVQVLPGLVDFVAKARDRGIRVALSSWFRRDRDDTAMQIAGPERMAAVWIATLRALEVGGVLDNILFVDLCNEYPGRPAAPFLYAADDDEWLRPGDVGVMSFLNISVEAVRAEYPDLDYTYSFTGEYPSWREQDLSALDLLEPHLWMASDDFTDFYTRVGWNWNTFAPEAFDNLVARGREVYFSAKDRYDQALFDAIEDTAAWSRSAGRPLVTTEGWAVIDYKDWPGLDWDWVLDLNARAVARAAETGRWAAICTSNFCGPQFVGVWRETDYHRRLTSLVKSAPLDDDLRSTGTR